MNTYTCQVLQVLHMLKARAHASTMVLALRLFVDYSQA